MPVMESIEHSLR
ncbi:hypothetical protein F383_36117 [Gossypium arboreum]|nr:hypothetical protein F383_36117 [Gossypium arboreum]